MLDSQFRVTFFKFPIHLKENHKNNYNDTTEYTMYNMELMTTPQGVQSCTRVSDCFAVKLVLIQNTVLSIQNVKCN